MARKCQISGKSGQYGHRVSHAKNKTKHVFRANLQTHRVYLAQEKRWIKLKLSTRMIRTLDKYGLPETLRRYKVALSDLRA